MRRERLPSVVAVAALFVAVGLFDLYEACAPLFRAGSAGGLGVDDLEVGAVGVVAVAGAVFLFRGHNWARWLLAGWMAFHVVLSVGAPFRLVAHVLIFGLLLFILFRPAAAPHFRLRRSPGGTA